MGSECRDAGIGYIDQRAAGLRLCLFDTAAPLDGIRIIAAKTLTWGDFTAELNVIGSSHAVTVRRGEAALREVLACVDPARLPGEPLVTVRGLDAGDRVERSEIAGAGGRLCYRFASRPVPLGPELAAAAERAAAENPPQSLHATFPGGPRGVPFTFLSCDTTPDGLEIYSVHTYPPERIAICSRSRISRIPAEDYCGRIPAGMPRPAESLLTRT